MERHQRRASKGWLPIERRGLIDQLHAHVPVGQRPCTTHFAVVTQQHCDRCTRPFCLSCLRHVERWLVCTRCLEELQRERAVDSLLGCWRRMRTEAVAGVIIVLVAVGLFDLVQHLLGPVASEADLARTALGRGVRRSPPAAPFLDKAVTPG